MILFNEPSDFQIIKQWLNYIKKENILSNSETILEKLNEIGMELHQIKKKIASKESESTSELDYIRKKIADKKIIKNKVIEKALQNTNGN